MQLKDYYTILELHPSATGDEIKKAYRRLFHQYHPDKKNNDPYAAAQFSAIKEAYETSMIKFSFLSQRGPPRRIIMVSSIPNQVRDKF